MVAFSTIKAGDVLWDCHRTRVGNTTMRQMGAWKVSVLSVDVDTKSAMVSWNGNPPRRWSERHLKKLRRTKVAKAR